MYRINIETHKQYTSIYSTPNNPNIKGVVTFRRGCRGWLIQRRCGLFVAARVPLLAAAE